MKKPTLATLKAFIRKNHSNLMIRCDPSFDGMIDGTSYNHEAKFSPIKKLDRSHMAFKSAEGSFDNTLGISGVWLVGSSRDHITGYSKDGMFGYEVYNCCGSFVVALDLKAVNAKANAIIELAQKGSITSWVNSLTPGQMSRLHDVIDGSLPQEIKNMSDDELLAELGV